MWCLAFCTEVLFFFFPLTRKGERKRVRKAYLDNICKRYKDIPMQNRSCSRGAQKGFECYVFVTEVEKPLTGHLMLAYRFFVCFC